VITTPATRKATITGKEEWVRTIKPSKKWYNNKKVSDFGGA